MKIAINGFGRIGRLVFRELAENNFSNLNVVAVNDLSCSSLSSHLLRYDSVHGRFDANISCKENEIICNEKKIYYSSIKSPENLEIWRDLGVDIVLECTGKFKSKEKCSGYIENGAKKIIISAPGKNVDKTIVFGVNDNCITKNDDVLSCASCTTNCLAPLVKVLKDSVGIISGDMLTIHSYTADQRLVDMSHTDLRRSRAAACNIVPTSTGAAEAIGIIFPDLTGKLHGYAMRVPTPNVSFVNFTFLSERKTSIKEINSLMKDAAETHLSGILGYNDEKLVSSDFISTKYSSIFDSTLTNVQDGNLCTVTSWYDNEYAFACRMIDLAKKLTEYV